MDLIKCFHFNIEVECTLKGFIEFFKEINCFFVGIGIYFDLLMLDSLFHFDYFIKILELNFFLTLDNWYLTCLCSVYITLSRFLWDFDISYFGFSKGPHFCFHCHFKLHYQQYSFWLQNHNYSKLHVVLYLVKILGFNLSLGPILGTSRSPGRSFSWQLCSLPTHFLYHFYCYFWPFQWSHHRKLSL